MSIACILCQFASYNLLQELTQQCSLKHEFLLYVRELYKGGSTAGRQENLR